MLRADAGERLLRVASQIRWAVRVTLAWPGALVVRARAEIGRADFHTVHRLIADHADDAVGARASAREQAECERGDANHLRRTMNSARKSSRMEPVLPAAPTEQPHPGLAPL